MLHFLPKENLGESKDTNSRPESDEEEEEDETRVSPGENEESIIQNVVHGDKKELSNLLEEFAGVVEEDDVSKLMDLEELLNNFLISQHDGYDRRSETSPKVHNKLEQLSRSIPLYKLSKAKMLVTNINNKRYIIRKLFNGIKDGQVDKVLIRLLQQGMISSTMFDKFRSLDNLENIADIMKV